MTTITETRLDRQGREYNVVVPIQCASELVYRTWIAEQLRDFLHREGCVVEHIPDDTLLKQTRNTFANTKARAGRITSANPVQSE